MADIARDSVLFELTHKARRVFYNKKSGRWIAGFTTSGRAITTDNLGQAKAFSRFEAGEHWDTLYRSGRYDYMEMWI